MSRDAAPIGLPAEEDRGDRARLRLLRLRKALDVAEAGHATAVPIRWVRAQLDAPLDGRP